MIQEYIIKIKETSEMEVVISASSIDEAKFLALEAWKNGDYILDAEHFKDIEFTIKECEEEW
ncbi:MAG: DpnD/PcfM family protein [Synergistaceae bacterium]|nr:DpnD/PcfM family protein [Synergistaceae bacterium]